MIERYSDHAANERTFLAWVRTGIAFVAFGFVLEKFHFFLVRIDSLGLEPGAHTGTHDTKTAGIVLVVFGLVAILGSIARYLHTDARIRSPELQAYSTKAATLLGVTLFVLGCFMLLTMIDL
jgi:putative membrane protein